MYNKKILGLAVATAIFSTSASAGLYINPVVKGSVAAEAEEQSTSHGEKHVSGYVIEPGNKPHVIEGKSEATGSYKMSEDTSDEHKVFSYGKNVPLKIALEKVIPESSSWLFKIDDGLSHQPVSWDGGESWEGVVNEISENNPINIVLNHSEKVVGVAVPSDLAAAMASRTAQVFKLDGKISLRKNLEKWAKESGYQRIVYSPDIHDIDYMVPDAVFLGAINAKGGSLDQMLNNLNERARVPLEAEFKEGNKIIYITKKTSKKEMY